MSCMGISHWFEPVAAVAACLSTHCEPELATVTLSARRRPSRTLGSVVVGGLVRLLAQLADPALSALLVSIVLLVLLVRCLLGRTAWLGWG